MSATPASRASAATLIRKATPPSGGPRIVGVDHGARRVGLAMTDPLRLFPQPIGTFGPAEAIERLRRLHGEEGIETVVVGWPLAPDGSEGPATRRVKPYVDRIQRALPGVRVVVRDERESSARAAEALVAGGSRNVSRRDPGRIDAAAAGVILQDYLEEIRAGESEEE